MTLPPIAFRRVLRAGSRGNDVFAVRRALARAGFGNLGTVNRAFNVNATVQLVRYQRSRALSADGVYGPVTHARLAQFFDDYSFLLYTGQKPAPPPAWAVHLPADFTPTHETKGLPGYPAIDVFGRPGAPVLAPVDGKVHKLSGHDPAEGGVPGGAYGWSIYIQGASADYFLTHFASRNVTLGQRVLPGYFIGTVCDAAVARMPSVLSHIHEGKHFS